MTMKMKRIATLLILSFLMLLGSGYAANGFNLSTNSLSDSLNILENSSSQFSIENTQNSSISMDINTNSQSEISLSTNQSSLTLLENQTKTITANYSSSSSSGTFTGEIVINQQGNSSNNEVIAFTLEVNSTNGPDLSFVDEDDTIRMNGELGENEIQTFTLKNTGSETLEEIIINLEDLEGDDDNIDRDDIEINDDDEDDFEILEMTIGEERDFKIEIDVPSNIETDTYSGDFELTAQYDNGKTFSKSFTLRMIVNSDEEDIFFRNADPLELRGESGDSIRNVELLLENDGNNDVGGLQLEFEEEFTEENSDATMPTSAVEFEDTSFTIGDEDDIEIDMDVIIPENQAQGTYTSDLEVLNAEGEMLDSITVEIEVIGDVFFEELTFPDTVEPGEIVEVEAVIRNEGTKLFRDVKLEGFVFNVNRNNEDLDQSTNNFLLNRGSEATKTLRFRIPEDASDGVKTLELKLTYENNEVIEVESLDISRPSYNLKIESNSINPRVATCQDTILSFIEVKNLGKIDERITYVSSIEGTNIESKSNTQDLLVDDRTTQTTQLSIEDLETGTYNVIQSVEGQFTETVESTLTINQCNGNGIDIDTNSSNENPTNTTNQQNQTTQDSVSFFGEEIDRTTAALASALGVIVVLIVVSLFFL